MFQLTINKSEVIQPLLTVAGVVDRKNAAILSNVLFKIVDNKLVLTATDLDIEISAFIPCKLNDANGEITVSAKKLVDIMRSLDDIETPAFSTDEKMLSVNCKHGTFKLACLPAQDFPKFQYNANEVEFEIFREELINLLQRTSFSLSQQDIRPFFNGLLFEVDEKGITTVAMDGHRMAIAKCDINVSSEKYSFIIPRKSVNEILRLLNGIEDDKVSITAGVKHFKLCTAQYEFVSKLIETKFPAFQRVIPINSNKFALIDKENLRRALMRIMILANEKSKAMKISLEPNKLTLSANNNEQEEARESVDAEISGDAMSIGVNASYVLDVLNNIDAEKVTLSFSGSFDSILIEPKETKDHQYVIMPMKI